MLDKHYIRKLRGEIMEIAKNRTQTRERWVLEWYLADRLNKVMTLMDATTADVTGDAWRLMQRLDETVKMLSLLGILPETFDVDSWQPVYEPLSSELMEKWKNIARTEHKNAI